MISNAENLFTYLMTMCVMSCNVSSSTKLMKIEFTYLKPVLCLVAFPMSVPSPSLLPFMTIKLSSDLCDHCFPSHLPSTLRHRCCVPGLHTHWRVGVVAPSCSHSFHLLHNMLCDDFPHLIFSDMTSACSPVSSHQFSVFLLEISRILPWPHLTCSISPVILNGEKQSFTTGTILRV